MRAVRRILLVAAQILALIATTSALAGPLDPPTHKLSVVLLEPTVKKPATPKLTMAMTPSQDYGALVIAAFEPKGKQRLLHDGLDSWYIEARRGGSYPSVAVNGSEQLPPCPAAVLCSTPVFPSDVEQYVDTYIVHFTPHTTKKRYYIYVSDTDVTYDVSPGWRVRTVKGAALMQFRDTGTEVRVSVPYRQYMVEDFHGVTAPRANGPSVAWATIPCWPPPAPGGSGHAFLRDNATGTINSNRTMDCNAYRSTAEGASDQPTVWRNDGASLGWSGGFVNRLVVAVLPPT
ncbi:MAG: hypothetical protein QOC82_2325 [Frankiaceae bacterium]|nr:hypothetical protein [Frankiaceae bacterium]